MTTLNVDLRGVPVGQLEQGEPGGPFTFTYREAAENPLSYALPVRRESFTDRQSRPFFDGLLPEGRARDQVERRLRVIPGDSFGLLAQIGRDCAGAVVVRPEDQGDDDPTEPTQREPRWLSEGELADLIQELPSRPLGIAPREGVRLSLAGVQGKLTLARDADGRFGIPTGDAPSTHLLKPQTGPDEFPDIVFNEYFCMSVVHRCGVAAAACELLEVGRHPCLLVRRFDRRLDEGRVSRLHQEDFCQALAIMPGRKYQVDGGPSLGSIAQVLRDVGGAADVGRLVRLAVLNYVLGNSDAHGKNFGLLYDGSVRRLTPAYDIVSTAAYPDLTTEMAMSIGDEVDPLETNDADWLDLSADCGLRAGGFLDAVRIQASDVVAAASRVLERSRGEGWHRPILDRILETCEHRAARILRD